MPRYIVDTDEGDHSHRDEDGLEFPRVEVALEVLSDMARDKMPGGDRRTWRAESAKSSEFCFATCYPNSSVLVLSLDRANRATPLFYQSCRSERQLR